MKFAINILILAVSVFFSVRALDLLPQNPIEKLKQETEKNLTVPNPYDLPPEWWHYFEVDEPELQERITKTLDCLQDLYLAQSEGEKELLLPLMTSIRTSLSALPNAKKEKIPENPPAKTIQSSYTLQEQLQVHQQQHALELERRTDQSELDQLRNRIAKAQQRIDSQMASYLAGKAEPTLERLIAGLDIISQRAALAIAEENLRLIQSRIANLDARLGFVEKELDAAKYNLDIAQINETALLQEIEEAQRKYEKAQRAFARAEAAALGIYEKGVQERVTKHLLDEKLLLARINEALAWSELSFKKLSLMLVQFVAKKELSSQEMRQTLSDWKEELRERTDQEREWAQMVVQQQEQVREDNTLLIAGNLEEKNRDLLAINQECQRVLQETMTRLHLLDETKDHMQWIVYQLEHYVHKDSHWVDRWKGVFTDHFTSLHQKSLKMVHTSLFKLFDVPFTLLSIIKIISIFIISYLVSKVVRRIVCTSIKDHLGMEASVRYNVGHLIHYFILFMGTVFALWSIGMNVNHVLLFLGALSFGIGFGLQSVAMNFFYGLKILFEGKIKIGDYIELSTGHKGSVTEINIQNTTIVTPDGLEVVIPNADLLKAPLVNWTLHNTYQRLHVKFKVAYHSSKDLVRRIVLEAAKKLPCTMGEPQVWLTNFGEDALTFELVVWVDSKIKTFSDSKDADYLWEIETALRKNKVPLPLPQHLLYLKDPNFIEPIASRT